MTCADSEGNEASAEPWEFEITPYIWLVGLEGDVSTGDVTSPVENENNLFVLENLDLYGAGTFEARKHNWALLIDGLYVRYSDDLTNRLFDTNLIMEAGFFEAVASYRLEKLKALEFIAGARYIFATLEITQIPGQSAKDRQDWVDPIVGLRFTWDIADKWLMRLRGDLGGFGVGSEFVYNALMTIEYRLSQMFSLKAGYRFMKVDFKENDFIYNISLSGFGLGLGIRF
jgi:hypothetical protein